MNNIKLKLNADNTECCIIATSTKRRQLDGFSPTYILSWNITPATLMLNLGVTFDGNFKLKTYIENMSLLLILYPRSSPYSR
ncbi:hypothetical protein NP493_1709g00013 [Ridgeia piscesae]|uniref:Uncharacterized protein n=1 Tax=Ridgeia piscesae TaxID=27915 RepID=A0AAD9NA02_RIDPI|nr:hypothetical protein NP493_1709g00013 [Ridgeia piscesae]